VSASVFLGHCYFKNALFIYHQCCMPKQLTDLGNKMLLVLSFCVSTIFFSFAFSDFNEIWRRCCHTSEMKVWEMSDLYLKCLGALTFQNLKEL